MTVPYVSGLELLLLALGLGGTAVGVALYRPAAERRGIIAKINSRTLHERIVPRGGGIAIGAVYSFLTLAYWIWGPLPTPLGFALFGGGFAATLIGFVDDVREISALPKLTLQAVLAAWITVLFLEPFYSWYLIDFTPAARALVLLLVAFIPLWLINLFNFIDGIDGLAASASVLTALGAAVVLSIGQPPEHLIFVFALLAAVGLGFLLFNFPPASIFMGDAGSIFLGYTVSVLLLATVFTGRISAVTWIAILAYYIADTTTTTLFRIFMVRRWYGVHRSHAYQNLARVLKAHAPVTGGIVLYQLLWALPLAVVSALRPRWGPAAAALAVLPAVLWTVRFGPRFSRD